jgi:hypothetical protein
MLSAKRTRYPGALLMDDARTITRLHKDTGGAQRHFCDSVQFLALEQGEVH